MNHLVSLCKCLELHCEEEKEHDYHAQWCELVEAICKQFTLVWRSLIFRSLCVDNNGSRFLKLGMVR